MQKKTVSIKISKSLGKIKSYEKSLLLKDKYLFHKKIYI